MPLEHSASNKARERNIKREIEHGKDPKQAVAIGYSEQREARKKNMKHKKEQKEFFAKGVHHEPIPHEHLNKPKHAHHGHHEGKNEIKGMGKHSPKLGPVACGSMEKARQPRMKMGKKK